MLSVSSHQLLLSLPLLLEKRVRKIRASIQRKLPYLKQSQGFCEVGASSVELVLKLLVAGVVLDQLGLLQCHSSFKGSCFRLRMQKNVCGILLFPSASL